MLIPICVDYFSVKELNSERLKGVRNTMHDLPKCHYETVKFLFKHLTK